MDEVTALKGLGITSIQKHVRSCISACPASVLLLFWYYSRINQKVREYARDRSKRPRFYAALFVSFTWEKVKTHVIRLRVIEGPNTHDQIAFSCIPFILSESSKECGPWVIHAAHASKQLEDYADCGRPHFGPLRSPAINWFDSNQEPIPTKSLSPFWRRSKTHTERLIAQVLTDGAFRL